MICCVTTFFATNKSTTGGTGVNYDVTNSDGEGVTNSDGEQITTQ